MSWLELIRFELGSIPMFMWQYAAVLGLIALTLVLTRPLCISARQAGLLHSAVLALAGYGISGLAPASSLWAPRCGSTP